MTHDRKEIFRQILIKLMNTGLLNEFISIVFNYDLDRNDFIFAQYKIINGDVTLEIFDNNNINRFNAYVFVENSKNITIEKEVNNNTSVTYLYLDNCYKKYKNNYKVDNLIKLALSFRIETINEFNKLILNLFPKKIEKIIYEEIKKN